MYRNILVAVDGSKESDLALADAIEMAVESNAKLTLVHVCNPPPGVGPYMITNVSPNRGWTMVKNPHFAALGIPNIPKGHLDTIKVNITSNTQSPQSILSPGRGRCPVTDISRPASVL